MVYDNLVEYEQGPGRNPSNPAIVPMMAESWEFNDAGTKLTFQLNEGMYWSDLDDPFQKGPEIVAEDFIYIFTQFRDDSVQSGNYRTLESIEAPSKYTVVLNFSTPSFWILPFMASKDGVMFNPHLDKAGRADRETRGPGPFILFEAKKSIAMQFKRNPNHFSKDQWGNALPYLDGISFTVVPDQGTRIAMMRTGKVDHAENLVGNVRGLTALLGTNPEFQVMANPGSGTSWSFSYQMNNPIFADINVRRALTLAYDGVGASNVVALGYGMPGDTKFAWWDWTFEPPTWDSDLDALYGKYHNHYDVPAAKELWAKGGLGDITLTIPLYTYGQYILDTAALLVADWRELGITLKPQSQDYSAFNALLQQRTAKDMIFAWQQQGYGPVGTALVKLYSTSPGNRENLNDPIIDGLIDQLAVEGDPAKVRSLTQQIRDQYNDQIYWTASYANAISFAIVLQPWVKGVRGGEFSSLTAYYPGKLYRHTWLDRD
jgi:peptide/nickel transport system substrate-binding protein